MVPRRRDAHGRPAARPGRAAADHPDRRGAASPAPGDDAPSGWLWVAALLLALNPARAAFGIPRAGRSPRERRAAWPPLGGAIGGLAVCAAAAVGRPAARRARRQRARRSASPPGSWPCWPAPSTCSGDHPRPSRRSPAGAPRSSRSRSPSWPAPRCWCWRWAPAPTRASSVSRRRDGDRRRAADRRWRPRCPPRAPAAGSCGGRPACWPPGSSRAASCSPSTGSWTSGPAEAGSGEPPPKAAGGWLRLPATDAGNSKTEARPLAAPPRIRREPSDG